MARQPAPNLIGQPNIEFRKNDFDAAIWNKGYDVTIEKAIRCPCKSRGGDNLSDCNNCRGFGWVFINPIETKAIITSLNSSNKYKAWSLENMNRANITVRDIDSLAYFDRITLRDDYSEISENLEVKKATTGEIFAFTSYVIKDIFIIFKFENSTTPLVKLSTNDYTVDNYKIIFNPGVVEVGKFVSVSYKYSTQFNVLDVVHNIRSSKEEDSNGNMQNMKLPLMCMAQKSHTIIDRPNFSGGNIINNSWE